MPTTKSKAEPTWTVHRGEDYAEIQKADGTIVFQVMSVYPDEEGDEIMRDLTTAAAAPDLLAALKMMLDAFAGEDEDATPEQSLARLKSFAIIAKAEGCA